MAQLQRLVVTPSQFRDHVLLLTRDQQHYLSQVLRLQAGQQFVAMDGVGQWWLAELVGEQHSLEAQILEAIAVHTELPVNITLVMALPKGNGLDDVVRQATELGVSTILPVVSDRTLLRPSDQRLERWRRIAQEAAEQCERQIVPTIAEPISFATYLQTLTRQEGINFASERYLCVTRRAVPHLLDLITRHDPPTAIDIAIGPEGGWTDAEIDHAIAAGFQAVSLGRRILRTVTAPIVALSLISATFET